MSASAGFAKQQAENAAGDRATVDREAVLTAVWGWLQMMKVEPCAAKDLCDRIRSLPAEAREEAETERLRKALKPFAEPHAMGDNYVQFSPRLIEAARTALREPDNAKP